MQFEAVIDDICGLKWPNLSEDDLVSVAWVYYYFSVQFGECLEIARRLWQSCRASFFVSTFAVDCRAAPLRP